MRDAHLGGEVERAASALLQLAEARDPELARTLAALTSAIATEASRTPRFAASLKRALSATPSATPPRRSGRRQPGPLDPFELHTQSGEEGLRSGLRLLSLEQLRDIVAEHGMDNDRLAMKWKDPERVIDRIVERVVFRASKGSAFRN